MHVPSNRMTYDERERFLARHIPERDRPQRLVDRQPPRRVPPPKDLAGDAAAGSYRLLYQLNQDYPGMIVMGGWAAWLHTGKRPSHDVDVIAPPAVVDEMRVLEEETTLATRAHVGGTKWRLCRGDGCHADIYVAYRSHLGGVLQLPVENLIEAIDERAGFIVLSREGLVAAKMAAALDRPHTDRGGKDLWDIADLLRGGEIDWGLMREVLSPRRSQAPRRLELACEVLGWLDRLDMPRAERSSLISAVRSGIHQLGGRGLA